MMARSKYVSIALSIFIGTVSASAAPYLSDVSLNRTSNLTGASTATGTVTLSEPATTAKEVLLFSSDSSVTVPTSVFVAIGDTTATFTLTRTAPTVDTEVTIKAKSGGWVQRCDYDNLVAPASTTITGIRATSGKGVALVNWDEVLPGVAAKVWVQSRIKGTSPWTNKQIEGGSSYVLLPTSDIYEIRIANAISGSTIFTSSIVEAQTVTTGPTLSFSTTVPSTATGDVSVQVTPSSGSLSSSSFFYNGSLIASNRATGQEASVPSMTTVLDTDDLNNSSSGGKLCAIGMVGGVPAVTSEANFNPSNKIYQITSILIAKTYNNEAVNVDARLATDTASWTVTVKDGSTVLRSWTGGGTRARVGWDGKDASGTPVATGDYTVELTAVSNTSQARSGSTPPWIVAKGSVDALALIQRSRDDYDDVGGVSRDSEQDYAAFLKAKWVQTFQNSYGLDTLVLYSTRLTPNGRYYRTMRKWFKNLDYFYLYDHGSRPLTPSSPKCAWFAGLAFTSGPLTPADYNYFGIDNYALINVNAALQGHALKFCFIDTCFGAGGDLQTDTANGVGEGDISVTSYNWAYGVNMYLSGDNAFLGFNGNGFLNGYNSSGTPTTWYQWRQKFWNLLLDSHYAVSDAVYHAHAGTTGTPGTPTFFNHYYYNPWGAKTIGSTTHLKTVQFGDCYVPF